MIWRRPCSLSFVNSVHAQNILLRPISLVRTAFDFSFPFLYQYIYTGQMGRRQFLTGQLGSLMWLWSFLDILGVPFAQSGLD